MSKVVRNLLLNYNLIRSKVDSLGSSVILLSNLDEPYTMDFDDPEYLMLLDIDRCINNLVINNNLTGVEKELLTLVISGRPLPEISTTLGISLNTTKAIFNKLCNRISFILGDIFTDDGYIEYMEDEYSLTPEQVQKLKRIL